jgi:diguanylate cyclase (GGDEF)-like protein/PAS domain S-box-containing protein
LMRVLHIALTVAILGFIASAFYISALVFQRHTPFEQVGLGNVTWLVAQAPSEFARLEQRVARYAVKDGSTDAAEVKLRFDIVVNRLKTLRTQDIAEFVNSDPRIDDILQDLEDALEAARPFVMNIADPAAPARILSILEPIYPKLVRLSTDANVWNIDRIANDRQGIFDLQLAFAYVSIGLIACGCALIVLLLVHNRLLDRAQTVLRQKERTLATQNARFDAALEAMTLGLCLLDDDYRILVHNPRMLTIFGLSPNKDLTGQSIFNYVDRKLLSEESASQVAGPVTDDIAILTDHAHHLPNGTVLMVSREHMAEGGWVCTFEDVTERHRAQSRVVHMARHDALTDMPNRVLFWESVTQSVRNLSKVRQKFAVLYLDLDRFKEVNDTLGHPIGDALLHQVAGRLRRTAFPRDIVARLGGDEFAVLHFCRDDAAQSTSSLAERIISAVGQPYHIEGSDIVVSTSVGIAMGVDGVSTEQLMKHADLALYSAKAAGSGTHRFFTPQMEEALQSRRQFETDLRLAVEDEQLELFYQPLVNLETGSIIGGEALMRWRHPDHGMISPAEFIPISEETGFIETLGAWALNRACRDALQWPDDVKVSVNLSPVQFRTGALVGVIEDALKTSGLDPRRLELEVTESILLKKNAANIQALHKMRSLGLTIALDDFGTGYSSLSYLQRFPFDKLKIDQSFVRDMESQPDSLVIVKSIIGLSRNLGMLTTAEGVETRAQLDIIMASGCNEAQGYYFGAPMPKREFMALISRSNPRVAEAGS